MVSLAFPKMFSNAGKTLTIKDHEATANNLQLLLSAEKKSLLGDPFFGTQLRQAIHSQNNAILKDLLIDEIYASIKTFMPQIKLSRSDITISSTQFSIEIQIKAVNIIDYATDLYSISLTESDLGV